MATGHLVLLIMAGGLLLFHFGQWVVQRGRPELDEEPNYEDPALQLNQKQEAHELFGELQSTLAVDHDADQRYLSGKGSERIISERVPVARKIVFAGLFSWLVVLIPYVVPGLDAFRILTPGKASSHAPPGEPVAAPMPAASVGEANLPGATHDQQARGKELEAPVADSRGPIAGGGKQKAATLAELEAPEPAETKTKDASKTGSKTPPKKKRKLRHPIDDPDGKALRHFFDKLARVDRKEKGAVARILYYGDSIVASDFVTGKLRRMLQDRFGDAGHGYAIIANAWPGWFHIDVSRKASANWKVSTCVGPYAKDGLYGLGCASFRGYEAGAWTQFATAKNDKWGRKVSSFEVEYLQQPGGGSLEVLVDGQAVEPLETNGEETQVAYRRIDVSDGAHTLKLTTSSDAPTRLFGIRMERDVPGVVLSAAGITGARARFIDKQDDEHFKRVLERAKPDLVVLAFGSNEITDGMLYPMDKFKETLGDVMKQIEAAVPNASLMLAGPPDMASKNAAQGHSRAMAPIIVKNQKQVAKARGWAYWDQYTAMGGAGSMWAWIQSGLGSRDMFHPTGQGGNLLGRWQYQALLAAYEDHLSKDSP